MQALIINPGELFKRAWPLPQALAFRALLLGCRQGEGRGCPSPLDAGQPDSAAVHFDDLSGDAHSQAETADP